MTLTAQNDEFYSGDHRTLTFTTKDDDDAVVDITGASLKWQVFRSRVSAVPEFTKVSGGSPSEIDITDAVNGVFKVYIYPIDTSALSGDFYHEAQLTDVNGNVTTVAFGTLTIKGDAIP